MFDVMKAFQMTGMNVAVTGAAGTGPGWRESGDYGYTRNGRTVKRLKDGLGVQIWSDCECLYPEYWG